MLFGSLTFLFLFFPLVSAVYYIAPNLCLKNIILLLFSFLFYAWGMTFFLILIGWVIFRVEGIKELVWVLTSMISINGLDVKSYLFNHATLLFSMCFLLPAALFSIKSWRLRSSLSYFLLYLLCLVPLVANSYNPFIYFRF